MNIVIYFWYQTSYIYVMMMRSRSLLSVIFLHTSLSWQISLVEQSGARGTPQWQRSGANKFRRHMQMVYPSDCRSLRQLWYYILLLVVLCFSFPLLNRSFAQQQQSELYAPIAVITTIQFHEESVPGGFFSPFIVREMRRKTAFVQLIIITEIAL